MTTIKANALNYTAGRTKAIDRIVVHYTAGDGDTARNNGAYFASGNRKSSAHYFVDETEVVASVPETDTAWHAGNWDMNCRSIGVEICSRKDKNGKYYLTSNAIKNAQTLVKELMRRHGIALANVIRHYDVTGKACPAPLVDADAWDKFKSGLIEDKAEETAVPVQEVASWAKVAWEKAKETGIMDGNRPVDPLTRQEMAVILNRLGFLK